MSAEPPVVLFSDVDSVLTSPASLPSEATSLLQLVAAKRLPLVLSSTRTRAELEFIQQRLGLRAPFICESGAAVAVPAGYFGSDVPDARLMAGCQVVEFGKPYRTVLDALSRASRTLGIRIVGFRDLSIEHVAVACGVPLLEASLAKMREYGEPFTIADAREDSRQRLFRSLRGLGFGCTTGGQYDHVGAAVDEGAGIDLLTALYRDALGRQVVTAGFGDPVRDAQLLQRVDIPIAIPHDRARTVPRIMKPGPDGREDGSAAPAPTSAWIRFVQAIRDRHSSGTTTVPPTIS